MFCPGHPSHSTGRILMKEHCAMKLTNKSWIVFPSSGTNSRSQAHKIKQPHLLQSINHKTLICGTVHEKLIFVDILGLHKGTILHMVPRAVEVILETGLSLGLEFLVT